MADFLDEKRREMQDRLKELRPLVDEFYRLEAAVAALDGVGTQPAPGVASRRRSSGGGSGGSGSSSSSSSGSGNGNGRRGRPRGTGTRGRQALELVQTNPGITIPEIAERMGIQQNYLYRVLPGLQKEGAIRKEGKGWHPMEPADAA
jgi:hypothetical protein